MFYYSFKGLLRPIDSEFLLWGREKDTVRNLFDLSPTRPPSRYSVQGSDPDTPSISLLSVMIEKEEDDGGSEDKRVGGGRQGEKSTPSPLLIP